MEGEMLDRLTKDLEYGHEQTCLRLSAPSPTFLYLLDLPDPVISGVNHIFSFHLTYGEQDDTLYVRYAQHQQAEAESPDENNGEG
jgi:hypothetical protein